MYNSSVKWNSSKNSKDWLKENISHQLEKPTHVNKTWHCEQICSRHGEKIIYLYIYIHKYIYIHTYQKLWTNNLFVLQLHLYITKRLITLTKIITIYSRIKNKKLLFLNQIYNLNTFLRNSVLLKSSFLNSSHACQYEPISKDIVDFLILEIK